MHLLLIGGAGHLGSIVRPALEREHTCRYLDTKPVPDAADRTIVADVNDDDALRAALEGIDVALYMALGVGKPFAWAGRPEPMGGDDPSACMSVNVAGLYRTLLHGLDLGVRRYVHASTLSIYENNGHPFPVDEAQPPDAWTPYGLSKRLAENVCAAAVQRVPDASILALRMMRPSSEAQWTELAERPARRSKFHPLGPRDVQRLYLAAVQFDTPGFHAIQAASDVTGRDVSHQRAEELIGWTPRGE